MGREAHGKVMPPEARVKPIPMAVEEVGRETMMANGRDGKSHPYLDKMGN